MGATLSRECVPVAEAQQEVLDNFGAHKRMEKEKMMMLHKEDVVVMKGSDASDIKPPGSQRGEAGLDLAPLCARDLQEGVVHNGRGLAGVILEAGICTGGSYFLLEDVLGLAYVSKVAGTSHLCFVRDGRAASPPLAAKCVRSNILQVAWSRSVPTTRSCGQHRRKHGARSSKGAAC